MSETPLRLMILARDASPRIEQARRDLEEFLGLQPGTEVVASGVTEDLETDGLDADLVVTLGGDGGILRACRKMGRDQRPILGVNLGRLGFLADLSPQEFRDQFAEIRTRNFRVVHHLMFECTLEGADGVMERHLGLNEVVVSSAGSMKMLDVNLCIDDEAVTKYSCDGLIIATPIGSTAHSLSAGGPILRQDLQGFVVTPICPHTLTNRPLIDKAESTYQLQVPNAPDGVMVLIDGQIHRPIRDGDVVTIRRAEVTFQLAKLAGHSFYGTLHRKLGWGGQPRYRNW